MLCVCLCVCVCVCVCARSRYKQNPYHNRIHAADVLQSLHVLIVRGGLTSHGYCDDISTVACYLSAVSA